MPETSIETVTVRKGRFHRGQYPNLTYRPSNPYPYRHLRTVRINKNNNNDNNPPRRDVSEIPSLLLRTTILGDLRFLQVNSIKAPGFYDNADQTKAFGIRRERASIFLLCQEVNIPAGSCIGTVALYALKGISHKCTTQMFVRLSGK